MESIGSSKKSSPAIRAMVVLGILIAVTAIPVSPAISQVSCYKGDVQEGNYIGEIDSTASENAGADCNSFYDDCQGQCLGCIYDDNLTEDVCYDNQGNKFIKPD